jgi:hypothetical protein
VIYARSGVIDWVIHSGSIPVCSKGIVFQIFFGSISELFAEKQNGKCLSSGDKKTVSEADSYHLMSQTDRGKTNEKRVIKKYMHNMHKEQFLERISQNITDHKFHLNIVSSESEPRYVYSIGLSEKFGFELLFAGGILYLKKDLQTIFREISEKLNNNLKSLLRLKFMTSVGEFSIREVDRAWSSVMGLGAFDYYNNKEIVFLQIVPDANHFTLDIPDMSEGRSISENDVWKYLDKEWDLPVPLESTVATNIDVLMGEPVTELMRWENNEWEMFAGAGPEVAENDMRVVSIATLIGIDPSLEPTMHLEIGKGLWRENKESEWNSWV